MGASPRPGIEAALPANEVQTRLGVSVAAIGGDGVAVVSRWRLETPLKPAHEQLGRCAAALYIESVRHLIAESH
jgi:hypothetical protein